MPSSLGRPILITLLLVCAIANADEPVGPFSKGTAGEALPSGWRLAKLPGVKATRFELVDSDGVVALRMDAADAGAALFRPVRIDPARAPILRWRWRVDNLIQTADIRRKDGDDLPARLYVMFDYPLERLSLIERGKIQLARAVAGDMVPAAAICYVWDGNLPAGTSLWNAYTDRVRVVVVESGSGRLGQWVEEQRDVAADFRAAFGEEPPPISGIAVGADTDQTGETVRAWFGDIGFSARAR
jgi:hypothetical protein